MKVMNRSRKLQNEITKVYNLANMHVSELPQLLPQMFTQKGMPIHNFKVAVRVN